MFNLDHLAATVHDAILNDKIDQIRTDLNKGYNTEKKKALKTRYRDLYNQVFPEDSATQTSKKLHSTSVRPVSTVTYYTNSGQPIDIKRLNEKVLQAVEENQIPAIRLTLSSEDYSGEKEALKNSFPELHNLIFHEDVQTTAAQVPEKPHTSSTRPPIGTTTYPSNSEKPIDIEQLLNKILDAIEKKEIPAIRDELEVHVEKKETLKRNFPELYEQIFSENFHAPTPQTIAYLTPAPAPQTVIYQTPALTPQIPAAAQSPTPAPQADKTEVNPRANPLATSSSTPGVQSRENPSITKKTPANKASLLSRLYFILSKKSTKSTSHPETSSLSSSSSTPTLQAIEEKKTPPYRLDQSFITKITSFPLDQNLHSLTEKISQTTYKTSDEALYSLQDLYEKSKNTLGISHEFTKLIGMQMSSMLDF